MTREKLVQVAAPLVAVSAAAVGATSGVGPAMSDLSSPSASSPIVEFRQYTLRPGQRDVLIDLFEREFVESQEALGMEIVGMFRDLDRPDRFVWIRGFRDMEARAEGLDAFYSGPVWKAHGHAANATMLDSDNVLLLRVARTGSGLAASARPRPPKGATDVPQGLAIANVYSFEADAGADFASFFDDIVTPELLAAGIMVRASYVSETRPNSFPRLPVREHERVFVWFSTFADPSVYDRCVARLDRSAAWRSINGTLLGKLKGQPEVLRLQPTPRSPLNAGDR